MHQEKRVAPLPSRLRDLVSGGKWTQKQIAEAVGVKPQSISQYLDGTVNPSYSVLIGLADLFGVSTDYLLGRTDIKTANVNIAFAAEETNLSERSISILKANKKAAEIVSRLLEQDSFLFERFVDHLGEYNAYTDAAQNDKKNSAVYSYIAKTEIEMAGFTLGDIFHPIRGKLSFAEADLIPASESFAGLSSAAFRLSGYTKELNDGQKGE